MNDKEFLFYIISEQADTNYPTGPRMTTRFQRYEDAAEAAKRASRIDYGMPYYVIEVCVVCNTITKIQES